jgi:hypothetical protein
MSKDQRSYTTTHPDAELIEAAGKSTKVAKHLSALAGETCTPSQVNIWRYRGIPPNWRPTFATLCAVKEIQLPKGWLAPNARAAALAPPPPSTTPAYLEV